MRMLKILFYHELVLLVQKSYLTRCYFLPSVVSDSYMNSKRLAGPADAPICHVRYKQLL
jgi:hypothetical protein